MATFSEVAKNAAVDAVADMIATLEIRTGSAPSTPEDADSGTLLAEFDAVAFDPAANGEAELTEALSTTGETDGTAGHFRFKDSEGNAVHDGTVTKPGLGGDLTLDNTSIATGQTVNVTGYTLGAS